MTFVISGERLVLRYTLRNKNLGLRFMLKGIDGLEFINLKWIWFKKLMDMLFQNGMQFINSSGCL